MKASLLEEKYGTPESLDSLLSAAVQNCPRAWQLWLKYAKEKWLRNDVDAARKILASAFEANSDNEEIWLAAVKLENRAKEVERARLLLQRARDKASTERVWMKSALFEREHGEKMFCHAPVAPRLSSIIHRRSRCRAQLDPEGRGHVPQLREASHDAGSGACPFRK